jgi:hypothetical protein
MIVSKNQNDMFEIKRILLLRPKKLPKFLKMFQKMIFLLANAVEAKL